MVDQSSLIPSSEPSSFSSSTSSMASSRPFLGRLVIGIVFIITGISSVLDTVADINVGGVIATALVAGGLTALVVQISRRAPRDPLQPH